MGTHPTHACSCRKSTPGFLESPWGPPSHQGAEQEAVTSGSKVDALKLPALDDCVSAPLVTRENVLLRAPDTKLFRSGIGCRQEVGVIGKD